MAATEIVMPRLSDTMEEGTILRWLKGNGDQVRRGEELMEIETDKATMTYESDQDGVLEILADEGDTLAVGEPIARVGTATKNDTRDSSAVGGASSGANDEEPADGPVGVRAVGGQPAGGSHERASPSEAKDVRIKASPLARRIAKENGVDLGALSGSGPGGRIVKADVQAAAGGRGTAGVATAKGETTTVELSRTQQTIARRMAESKATIPDFALQAEVNMEGCVRLRAELKKLSHRGGVNDPGGAEGDSAPTYNDMVVKACALALREHPRANGSYRDGRLQLHSRVNVGVAVAVDGDGPAGGALVVPTVFDAEEKSLGEIARETRALAARVREGTITPPELGGGTFTVSNLGMFGVRSFTAIVNPPQAAILSVGSLERRAVVLPAAAKGGHGADSGGGGGGGGGGIGGGGGGGGGGGEIVARHTMAVMLVCDHRILYGADAARFLARIRELLETPAALTL
ncbi:MAG TPA: dihydrolipoamide acetyltransferase family protein [Solirubrobacteraceae bacterium]